MLTPFQTRALRALVETPFFRAVSEDCMRWVQRTSVRKGEILFGKAEPSGDCSDSSVDRRSCSRRARRSADLVRPRRPRRAGRCDRHRERARHVTPRRSTLTHSEFATVKRRETSTADGETPVTSRRALRGFDRRRRATVGADRGRGFPQHRSAGREGAGRLARADSASGSKADLCIQLRQQDLADVLGLSRESVSKVLTSRAMRGKVELGRGRIVLLGV